MYWVIFIVILKQSLSIPTDDSLDIEMRTLYMTKKIMLEPYRCIGYVVNANYRKTELLINTDHTDYLLITDTLVDECDVESFKTCPQNSTFCVTSKNLTGSSRYSVGKCLSDFYVYFYFEDFQKGDISARINSAVGCDNIAETQYTTCAQTPVALCGIQNFTANTTCNKKCFLLECTYLDSLKKNQSSLQTCLPAFLQNERFAEICSHQYYYNNAMNKFPAAHYCGGKNSFTVPTSINEIKTLSFEQLVIFLVVICVIILLFSIIYYRIQLKRTGRQPFTPPSWMPESFFPKRRSVVFQEQKELTSYRHI